MIRTIALSVIIALTTGCAMHSPPINPSTKQALFLAKANDGTKVIEAESFAYQYSDDAALQWVHVFVTSKGLYAIYWDQFSGSYGLSLRLKMSDIALVENKRFTRGIGEGTMLVVKDVDGYEWGFASEKPGGAIETALRKHLSVAK